MVCAVDVCLCGMQELRTEILPRINSAVANIHSQLDGQSLTHCCCSATADDVTDVVLVVLTTA